jgi:hypothetical protein
VSDPAIDDECIHGILAISCGICGPRAAERRKAAADRRAGVEQHRPMHLLVKWNPDRDPAGEASTLERHRQTAIQMGSTWWGCDTDGETKSIDTKRLDQFNWQLEREIPTHAFLFKTGDDAGRAEVWRAQVRALTQEESEIDVAHRPPGMSTAAAWLFIELTDFEPMPTGWVVDALVRWDEPTESILSGLRTRTSPLFVGAR